ncbi:unnamed protein product, partial [Rotaria sordida]
STVLLSLLNPSTSNYTYYQYIYLATSNLTLLSFAFRHDSAYWCLDDTFVRLNNSSTNLLINGGFEMGELNGYTICNFNSSPPSGGIVRNQCARNSTYAFSDGSYLISDYLWQTFTTVQQQQYQTGFWLRNFGSTGNSFKATIGPYTISNVLIAAGATSTRASSTTTTRRP